MAPVIRATLEDNTTTPLASPSRCAKAYVSPGAGSTPCKGGPLADNAGPKGETTFRPSYALSSSSNAAELMERQLPVCAGPPPNEVTEMDVKARACHLGVDTGALDRIIPQEITVDVHCVNTV